MGTRILLLIVLCLVSLGARGQVINTVAGNGYFGSSGDGGPATNAEITHGYGVAIDRTGNIYIADVSNNKIRKVDTTGIITTVAGNGTSGYSGDGGPATNAQFGPVYGLATDLNGNIYISDPSHGVIRKVDTLGIISTVAGGGYGGDGGDATAASLSIPRGIIVDKNRNLFIADELNHRIRKVDSFGIITTIVGNGSTGYSGDGGLATLAKISYPWGLCLDKYGNLFFSVVDSPRIRKVDTLGIITTIAGNGIPGYTGDSATATGAELFEPLGITVDSNNNIYIGSEDGYVRKIDNSGQITTIAGITLISGLPTTSGPLGDGAAANTAFLGAVYGLATDKCNNLYISTEVSRIRKIDFSLTPINGLATVCIGSSITLFDSTSGGNWSSSDTTVATVNSSGIVTGISLGSSSGSVTISYTTTNSCGTTTAIRKISVRQLPNITTSCSPSAICVGSITTLSAVASGTGSYSWSPSASLSTSTGAHPIANPTITTTYTVTGTNVYGCVNTASLDVPVNPLPTITVSPSPTSICSGSSATLTASGGVTYSWSPSTALSATTSSAVTASPTVSVSYTATGTDANGCVNSSSPVSVTVNPLPATPAAITGTTTVCSLATTTLYNSAGGGSWSSSATGTASVDAATGVVTGGTAGTATITYTISNSCGSPYVTTTVTVNPLADAGTITGASSVCVSATTTLSDATGSGTWSASNANATVNSLGMVTGVTAGSVTISYSVTNSCNTAYATYAITINPLPNAGVISGITNMCEGTSTTLSSSGDAGGSWSSSNTSVSTVISSTGVVTATSTFYAARYDTITYTVTNGCGTRSAFTKDSVKGYPSIGGSGGVCIGSSDAITGTPSGGTYTWSPSCSGCCTTAGGVSGLTITGVSSGTAGTVTYTFPGSISICAGAPYRTVSVLPPSSASISGASTVTSATGTVLTGSGYGTTSYTWWYTPSSPRIALSGATISSVTVTMPGSNGDTGTIRYCRYNNPCPVTCTYLVMTKDGTFKENNPGNNSSIEESADNIKVYPNPTNTGTFTIAIPSLSLGASIAVTDINGRIVLEKQITEAKALIDLSGKPAGVYLLQVVNGIDKYQGKITLE